MGCDLAVMVNTATIMQVGTVVGSETCCEVAQWLTHYVWR
jgi:hypothetical protein